MFTACGKAWAFARAGRPKSLPTVPLCHSGTGSEALCDAQYPAQPAAAQTATRTWHAGSKVCYRYGPRLKGPPPPTFPDRQRVPTMGRPLKGHFQNFCHNTARLPRRGFVPRSDDKTMNADVSCQETICRSAENSQIARRMSHSPPISPETAKTLLRPPLRRPKFDPCPGSPR